MDDTVCERIGERVRNLMLQKGLNQKELAAEVDVTEAAMSRYLAGDRVPKIETVAKLAKALHTTTDYLICGDAQETDFDEVYKTVRWVSAGLNDKQRLALMRLLV